jgi:hypothetical protein
MKRSFFTAVFTIALGLTLLVSTNVLRKEKRSRSTWEFLPGAGMTRRLG